MTITKYFRADVDDATRIAVVTSADEDAISECPEARHGEIPLASLPADFANWKLYTAHAYSGLHGPAVEVMSRNGE